MEKLDSAWYHLLCNKEANGFHGFVELQDELYHLEDKIVKQFGVLRDMSGALALDTGTATYISLALPEGFYLHKL